MSDMAFDSTADEVNVGGSVLDGPPAETQQEETEYVSRGEPGYEEALAADYEQRISALENEGKPSPEFVQGYTAAQRGETVQLQPGDPGYVEWAQSQIEALRQEQQGVQSALAQYVQQAMASGDAETIQQATNLFEGITSQMEEQQAAAEWQAAQEAQYEQAVWNQGLENVGNEITHTVDLVGAEPGTVDSEQALQLAASVFGVMQEKYGPEHAAGMWQEIVQRSVAHLSDQHEEGMEIAFDTAEKLAKDLGGKADPLSITQAAADLYRRELYRSGGDYTEAARSSMMGAAKVLAGFSEKSQPEKMSLASLYSSVNKAFPRAEAPKQEAKVQLRDSKGRFVSGTPLAAKYAAKSPETVRAEAEKQAINQMYKAAFGGQ